MFQGDVKKRPSSEELMIQMDSIRSQGEQGKWTSKPRDNRKT